MAVAVQITDQAGDGGPFLARKAKICHQLGAGRVFAAVDPIAEGFQIVRTVNLIRLSKCAFTAQSAIRRLGRSRLRDGQLVRLRFRCPGRGRQQADDHHKGHQQG